MITVDKILEIQRIMDEQEVPQEDRIVELLDPDTGEYVSSTEDPDRVREILQKYLGVNHGR